MPLNDERPTSSSSGDEQGSDVESEHCDSMTSTSEGFSSNCSSKNCTPSSSPPKVITMDEVMKSASDLFNLSITHEITVNHNFHLQPASPPPNSLWKLVSDNVHKAFWDILERELNDDPPEYDHAIRLLEEIREILLTFPVATQTKTQIMEVLDMDLIRQQVDNDAVDIQGLASYIISTMGKLCAPIRDQEIRKLQESTDNIVTLFREIFRVLDLMKADHINFTIDCLQPVLQRHGVECERKMFQNILEKTPSALDHTTSWIKSVVEDLQSTTGQSPGKGEKATLGPFQIINAAFLRILTWDSSKRPLPETLMTDESRLQEIRWKVQRLQAVSEVLLIVHSTVGGPIQGFPSLSERLKRMTSVLLDGMHSPHFNLKEALEGVSAQICCELNKSLAERKYPALTPELQATLAGQICNITQPDNPIRMLVEERVQQYVMMLICDPKPQARLEQIPVGLTYIKAELAVIGAKFISLVNYNKKVYGPFYADIIRKLMFSDSPPSQAPPPPSAARDGVATD